MDQPSRSDQPTDPTASGATQQIFEASTGSSVILNAAENEALRKQAAEAAQKKPNWRKKLQHRWDQVPPKRRKIMLIGSLAGLAAVIILVVVFSVIAKVSINYRDSYLTARDLKDQIQAIRNDYDCQRVTDYVNSPYNAPTTYAEYIDGCRNLGTGAADLVNQLGRTEGVMKNPTLAGRYDNFAEAYATAMDGREKISTVLDAYTTWHNFVVAAANVDGWDETDADLEAAAKLLIESGVPTFAEYGEGWLQRKLAAALAYRNYYNASFTAPDKEELRQIMLDAQKEFTDYKAANEPNLSATMPLEAVDMGPVYSSFEELYSLITELYEANYQKGSGDCKELIKEVVCS